MKSTAEAETLDERNGGQGYQRIWCQIYGDIATAEEYVRKRGKTTGKKKEIWDDGVSNL